jgi:putative methyltransferase
MFPVNFPVANKFKNKNNIKVKFLTGATYVENKLYVNPSVWILKSYYNRYGLNSNKVSWLDPVFNNEFFSKEDMIKIIKVEKPDVLCFGLYIWNNPLYASIGKYVKENWPNIVLIAGGPNIYAHKDLDKFWKEYSWLDAVAYGDGEKAFATIIDTLIDSSQIAEGTNISYISNLSENILLPHERFKDKDFTFVSPVIENKDSIRKEIIKLREQDSKVEVCINWDFTRGCPYACSFCDWSSGLHHKISRKK